MVCLGLEPGVTEWNAQTNPLSYGCIQSFLATDFDKQNDNN